jgi:hypothetical protein
MTIGSATILWRSWRERALPLRCSLCGAQMRLIAFVTAPSEVKTILARLGEPTTPPTVARARGPPLWEQAPEPMANWDEAPAPVPEFVFDQRVSW